MIKLKNIFVCRAHMFGASGQNLRTGGMPKMTVELVLQTIFSHPLGQNFCLITTKLFTSVLPRKKKTNFILNPNSPFLKENSTLRSTNHLKSICERPSPVVFLIL